LFSWESEFERVDLSEFERKVCVKLGYLDEEIDGEKRIESL